MNNSQTNRQVHLDLLRAFAPLGIVLFHTIPQDYLTGTVGSFNWIWANLFTHATLWPVSIFVMISGALLLRRDISIKRLYSHNILRLLLAYIGWNLLYALWDMLSGGWPAFWDKMVAGHYHLWFLPMLIGLYMLVPLLRKIVENKSTMRYFLLLSGIFTILLPQAVNLVKVFNENLGNNLQTVKGMVDTYLPIGWVFFFVLGYYLNTLQITGREKQLRVLSCCIFALVSVVMALIPLITNRLVPMLQVYDYTVLMTVKCIAIFLGARAFCPKPIKAYPLIQWMSRHSFGVYLVHAAVLAVLRTVISSFLPSLDSLPLMVLLTIATYLISICASWVLSKIPVINKYLV